ncbi:hypothetical protein BJF93_21905 [Xaviernesmea oryzae]|uniref:FAD-dependent urate hydroxylase HpyO/Asp monooxygenase CreE-like FAD/NAD(P)-binding domain-containing protein n=1 Tax=Xaviernesmea oryzae TaxID=464029 RepID=A0A1Q9AWC6_9HYPH|nr:FAD/NAD(P)-binding protein [Xaviernesmea oryzae]OLP59771.1 hypothetical protein BJF93_21905 [Xaviernesmea oryzae]SEM10527.1 Uncharacterized NAD(P)/FAD-binding protein YdhS [Xaviernesmea oryzae]
MTRIAIIGSGPTGIYALKGLIRSKAPLAITVYEESPDAGKGTPYHPAVNDRAMLANIASIEIPIIVETLVGWLSARSFDELQAMGIEHGAIGDREFYPRVVLGDYLAAQFWSLVALGMAAGHSIDVCASHKVTDIRLGEDDITLAVQSGDGSSSDVVFDHVVMATGHDWPANTETSPGYFVSPWPASAIRQIGPVSVAVLGTSLSGIDAVVSIAGAHGIFLRDEEGMLGYQAAKSSDGLKMTMMSRKGLLPEADFYCPIPYEPLTLCTQDAMARAIAEGPAGLLDKIFELFRIELAAADPDYAGHIGLAFATVEDFSGRYFRDREEAPPFAWAARNLAEAKLNKAGRMTVQWRYAILRMHEVIAAAIPHLNTEDLDRFHRHFKTVFVDDYATVPHESIERLLALHRAKRLKVLGLGEDYGIEKNDAEPGVTVKLGDRTFRFAAFVDATGQHPLSASDLPFPSLRQQKVVKEAKTRAGELEGSFKRTGGVDVDDDFRPIITTNACRNLYCVSVPFLLHKLPFVQGITSAHQLGIKVAKAILEAAGPKEPNAGAELLSLR